MVDSREGEESEPSRLPAAQPGRLRTKKNVSALWMVDSRSRALGAILPRPAADIIEGYFS